MKKKILILTIIFTLIFTTGIFANEKTVSIYINGKKLETLDAEPVLKDSRTFLPARIISEKLNYTVDWNHENQSVLIKKGDDTLTLKIGDKFYYLNGNKLEMDVAPFIENSRTFVPVRFIAEAFGKNVGWNKDKYSVYIDEKEFVGDKALDKHLDKKKIFTSLINEPVGSASPKLAYANKDYSIILNYNGILIIDNKTGKLKGAIDNRALEYNKLIGEDFVTILGNDKNMILIAKYTSPKSGYIYSIDNNKLQFYEDTSLFNFTNPKVVNLDAEKEILDKKLRKDNISYSMVEFDGGFSYFEADYNNIAASRLTVMNSDFKEIIEFKLSSIMEK